MGADIPPFTTLDGYRLVRFLGRGGFGEVWLCQSETMGDYRALKIIPAGDADRLKKEYEALLHYRKAAVRLRSRHLVSIEHVNRNEAGLYYVMPLADGIGADDPSDPAWKPLSLATVIDGRAGAATWFSSREIIDLIQPILDALQTLSDAGLIHRDVKPENILLFHGEPCLGDISLLGADAPLITRRGTPGYGTPSWYVGGHPDMYGVAATLFTLLTGNLPDRMGRSAFLWPPQGEASLSPDEQTEWKRLHAVIRRATEESVAERYVDFKAMATAISTTQQASEPKRKRPRRTGLALMLVVCVVGFWLIARPGQDPGPEPVTAAGASTPAVSSLASPSSLPAPQLAMRTPKIVDSVGRFESMRQKITDQLGVIISSPSTGGDAPKRLDPTAYAKSSAVMRSFKARDYSACLEALEAKHAADGVSTPEPEAVLFRCYLLVKLGSPDEAEQELVNLGKRPRATVTNHEEFIQRVTARLVLWEALGGYEQGANQASEAINMVWNDPDKWPVGSLERLHQLRARMLILSGDYAAVLADKKSAIALPLPRTTAGTMVNNLNYTEAQARQSHLNTMVMQWELLEQEFPDYAAYLESLGSPEPQPDRRDLRDVD